MSLHNMYSNADYVTFKQIVINFTIAFLIRCWKINFKQIKYILITDIHMYYTL